VLLVSINPNAEDIPNNGIDEDCNGEDTISTAIQKLSETKINIYPNPTSGFLMIQVDGTLSYNCMIYDFQGRLRRTQKNNSNCDLSQSPSGLYHIIIEDIETSQRIVERVTKKD